MIKRKCPGCNTKIERNYNFCPWCGHSIKVQKDKENFGLLGKSDEIEQNIQNLNQFSSLPFGLDKMVGPLIKQIERELSNMEKEQGIPQGFNIRIQTGNPKQMLPAEKVKTKNTFKSVTLEETKRRQSLKKQEAESKVKRLSDKIIYEINAPGVNDKREVSISKLEKGFEIKIYTKDTCYIKNIPLQLEIENYSIKNNKVIIEFQN